jgi:1-acyl-sn-glycerol-3-phosphate acyltransferase
MRMVFAMSAFAVGLANDFPRMKELFVTDIATWQRLASILFLSLFPLAIAYEGWKAYRLPTEYSPWERMLYAPAYALARLLWRVEMDGQGRLSDRLVGGAVLVANHRCSLDPFFIQIASGRRVHWMVAGEYFRNPVFGPLLRILQAIPTNRSGADNAAIKTAIRLAAEGRYVGMFPEGRINRTTRPLHSIRSGAAMVAHKAGVPLIPCWIEGAPVGWAVWSGFFLAAHVKVSLGQPVVTSSPSPEQRFDDLVVMQSAMRQSLQLGGYPDYPVQFAGRRRP